MQDNWTQEAIVDSKTDRAAIHIKLNELERRIGDNDRLTEGIHKISTNVEVLTEQVKALTERLERNIQLINDKIDEERSVAGKGIKDLSERMSLIENKPAKRFENITTQIVGLLIAAIVGIILAEIGLGG
jgi:hypothetical protein